MDKIKLSKYVIITGDWYNHKINENMCCTCTTNLKGDSLSDVQYLLIKILLLFVSSGPRPTQFV